MNKLVESEAFIDPIKIEGTELKNYFLRKIRLLSVLPCRRKDGMLSCYGWSGWEGKNGVQLVSIKMRPCHFFQYQDLCSMKTKTF